MKNNKYNYINLLIFLNHFTPFIIFTLLLLLLPLNVYSNSINNRPNNRILLTSQSSLTIRSTSTANFGNQGKKDKITLKDLLMSEFSTSPFNGTWLTDNQIIYRDINANILTLNITSTTGSCSAKKMTLTTPTPTTTKESLQQTTESNILLQPQVLVEYYNFVS